jgi:hypothetical protein
MFSATDQVRTLIDTIPTLVWTARPDGSADFFNRRWLDFEELNSFSRAFHNWEGVTPSRWRESGKGH